MLRAVRESFFLRLGPEAALDAVDALGLRPTGQCAPLRFLENRVWDIRLEDDSHVIVKFYRPERWSRHALEDEHRFLRDLRRAEIPVCVPLADAQGATLHQIEGVFYGVWPRTGGREPDELSDAELPVLGRLLARIHAIGATREAAGRPRLSSDRFLREPLSRLEAGGVLPAAWAPRYRAAVEEAARVYDERSRDVPVHRIHGDCHLGNLLRGREGWFFLDFDDFVVGPAVHDVWMLLPGRDAEGARQRELLLEGYRQFHDFDPRWLELVEPLRAVRFLRITSWIASRWEESSFRSTFPHFGTTEYWEKETRDLEEQVARLRGDVKSGDDASGRRSRADDAPEPELTNKDFFWDL